MSTNMLTWILEIRLVNLSTLGKYCLQLPEEIIESVKGSDHHM